MQLLAAEGPGHSVTITSLVPTLHCKEFFFQSMTGFHLSNHGFPKIASHVGKEIIEKSKISACSFPIVTQPCFTIQFNTLTVPSAKCIVNFSFVFVNFSNFSNIIFSKCFAHKTLTFPTINKKNYRDHHSNTMRHRIIQYLEYQLPQQVHQQLGI